METARRRAAVPPAVPAPALVCGARRRRRRCAARARARARSEIRARCEASPARAHGGLLGLLRAAAARALGRAAGVAAGVAFAAGPRRRLRAGRARQDRWRRGVCRAAARPAAELALRPERSAGESRPNAERVEKAAAKYQEFVSYCRRVHGPCAFLLVLALFSTC